MFKMMQDGLHLTLFKCGKSHKTIFFNRLKRLTFDVYSSSHSSPPEECNRSKPLSKTRISTSHEDVSKDDSLLGDGDFRRVKSERRPKNFFRRNYKLPSKDEEKLERQRSLRLRESIRAKYGLPKPSRKNPLLSD